MKCYLFTIACLIFYARINFTRFVDNKVDNFKPLVINQVTQLVWPVVVVPQLFSPYVIVKKCTDSEMRAKSFIYISSKTTLCLEIVLTQTMAAFKNFV